MTAKPFQRSTSLVARSSHEYVYEVTIKERCTYKVYARGRVAAEAIRAAEKHFLSAQGINVGAPWSIDVHDRRCEATLVEKVNMLTPEEVIP